MALTLRKRIEDVCSFPAEQHYTSYLYASIRIFHELPQISVGSPPAGPNLRAVILHELESVDDKTAVSYSVDIISHQLDCRVASCHVPVSRILPERHMNRPQQLEHLWICFPEI